MKFIQNDRICYFQTSIIVLQVSDYELHMYLSNNFFGGGRQCQRDFCIGFVFIELHNPTGVIWVC